MKFSIEKDWITGAGLRAVIIMIHKHKLEGFNNHDHRCGYVAVAKDSPFCCKGYDEQLDCLSQELADSQTIGQKSPILALTATCSSDDEFSKVRRSLDVCIDVHGGLTYSGGDGEYPVEAENLWWFGFDCAHYGDDNPDGGQSLDYCIAQCESMAAQLVKLQ